MKNVDMKNKTKSKSVISKKVINVRYILSFQKGGKGDLRAQVRTE